MGCNLSNSGKNQYLNDDSIATFSKLRISPASVEKLRKIFNKIDADGSGEIDYTEFIHHFGFKRSRFTKRAFSVMDEDGSGHCCRALGNVRYKAYSDMDWQEQRLEKRSISLFPIAETYTS